MNNQNPKIKSQKTKHFLWPLLLLSIIFSSSCKKDFKDPSLEIEQIEIVRNLLRMELKETEKKFGKELFVLMKEEPKIKTLIIDMCIEQEHGDYYVLVNRFLTEVSNKYPENKERISKLKEHYNELKRSYRKTEPIIFLPSSETREEQQNLYTTFNTDPEEPVDFIVIDDDDPGPGYSYPGYYLDMYNNLTYYQYIDEEFAWNNDVFVIGFEEDLPAASMVTLPGDEIDRESYQPPFVPMAIREPGREEYGAIIQVINMNEIEHWRRGKFEFSYYVVANGTTIHQIDFERTRRKHFKDHKWFNFNNKIGYWNIPNWGNMHIEGWRERTGGQDYDITFSWSPGQGLPTTTIRIPAKDLDKDLGRTNVQFTDPCLPEPGVTTYQISHMNFRRETKN